MQAPEHVEHSNLDLGVDFLEHHAVLSKEALRHSSKAEFERRGAFEGQDAWRRLRFPTQSPTRLRKKTTSADDRGSVTSVPLVLIGQVETGNRVASDQSEYHGVCATDTTPLAAFCGQRRTGSPSTRR